MRRKEEQLLETVITEVIKTFFQLQTVGKRLGMVVPVGKRYWEILQVLKEGKKTVPQIARSRSMSRQWIQKLADEMTHDGMAEFVDNPDHKRSKLLRLTGKGEEAFEKTLLQITQQVGKLGVDMDEFELKTTEAALKEFQIKLNKMALNLKTSTSLRDYIP